MGPQISGKCYYANCKLAFTTFSAFMWGKHAPPGGCWITLVTRVMEKPAILTQLLFDKVLEVTQEFRREVQWGDWLTFWGDVGPHFRNYDTLGYQATVVTDE